MSDKRLSNRRTFPSRAAPDMSPALKSVHWRSSASRQQHEDSLEKRNTGRESVSEPENQRVWFRYEEEVSFTRWEARELMSSSAKTSWRFVWQRDNHVQHWKSLRLIWLVALSLYEGTDHLWSFIGHFWRSFNKVLSYYQDWNLIWIVPKGVEALWVLLVVTETNGTEASRIQTLIKINSEKILNPASWGFVIHLEQERQKIKTRTRETQLNISDMNAAILWWWRHYSQSLCSSDAARPIRSQSQLSIITSPPVSTSSDNWFKPNWSETREQTSERWERAERTETALLTFLTCTAASHQGAIQLIWLHFWEPKCRPSLLSTDQQRCLYTSTST